MLTQHCLPTLHYSTFYIFYHSPPSHIHTLLLIQALDFELKRAEVRDAERVEREAELQTELEAAKQDMGTYPQVL